MSDEEIDNVLLGCQYGFLKGRKGMIAIQPFSDSTVALGRREEAKLLLLKLTQRLGTAAMDNFTALLELASTYRWSAEEVMAMARLLKRQAEPTDMAAADHTSDTAPANPPLMTGAEWYAAFEKTFMNVSAEKITRAPKHEALEAAHRAAGLADEG